MISITVEKLLQAKPVLEKLFTMSAGMPPLTALMIAETVVIAVNPHLQASEGPRKRCLEKHGAVIDENGQYSIPQENLAAAVEELKPMLEATIKINATPWPRDMLEKMGDVKLTPIEALLLMPFVEKASDQQDDPDSVYSIDEDDD